MSEDAAPLAPPADPPAAPPSPADVIRALGFDPDAVRAVVVTPEAAVAIAADYPEPYVMPEEATHGSD